MSMILLVFSCRPSSPHSESYGYFHEGQMYGYGSILLSSVEETPKLLLKRVIADQRVDNVTSGLFSLVEEGASGEHKEVVYVDLHPEQKRPIIYNHHIVTQFSRTESTRLDVWAKLVRASPSNADKTSLFVYLGHVRYNAKAKVHTLIPFWQVNMSQIYAGDQRGHLALHYAPAQSLYAHMYDHQYCQVMLHLPSHFSDHRPASFNPERCMEASPVDDVCQSNPTNEGCIPKLPEALVKLSKQKKDFSLEAKDMVHLDKEMYRLIGNDDVGLIHLNLKDEFELSKCETFAALTRGSRNYRNDSCSVHLERKKSQESEKCVFRVEFDRALSYEQKVCHVILFDTEDDNRSGVITILKR